MSRLFVIGDVHGMAAELLQLISALDPQAGDRFAFLGDYVDKGPNSQFAMGVVRDALDKFPDSVAIPGNHEDSAMRLYAKSQKQGNWDGLRKAVKEPWLKDMTEDEYQWLRSLPLIARPIPGVILVHGGMFPAFFEKHGALGEVTAGWHRGGGKRMDRMRRFLRVRHIYKPGSFSAKGKPVDGQMVSLGDEGESTQDWAEWYDGREGFAFYGHAPQRDGQPLANEHALGLDTGAVFGGKLTAWVLEDGQPPQAGHMVQVDGEKHADWLEAFEA
jgi:hypothetical protein